MSKKVLIDKEGLIMYHDGIMKEYIKPLQDIVGMSNDGYGGKGSVQAKQFKVGDNVVIRERQNAISNLTSTDTTQTIVAKVNTILSMLRTHGLIEES